MCEIGWTATEFTMLDQGRPQGIGGPRRGPRRNEFGGPK